MSARERESGLIHLQMSDQQTNSFSLTLLQTDEIQDKDKSHKGWQFKQCLYEKRVYMIDAYVCVSMRRHLNAACLCIWTQWIAWTLWGSAVMMP